MRGRKPSTITTASRAVHEAPRVPSWLSKEAKAEWRRVVPILVERKVLTEADFGTLETYVTASGQVRECQKIIAAEGLTTMTPTGPRKHPAVAIQSNAMTQARLCAAELGLTPVSRSRPSIRDDVDDDTDFLG